MSVEHVAETACGWVAVGPDGLTNINDVSSTRRWSVGGGVRQSAREGGFGEVGIQAGARHGRHRPSNCAPGG